MSFRECVMACAANSEFVSGFDKLTHSNTNASGHVVPVAQLEEQAASNCEVPGSTPGGDVLDRCGSSAVERRIPNPKVVGSIPSPSALTFNVTLSGKRADVVRAFAALETATRHDPRPVPLVRLGQGTSQVDYTSEVR